MWPLPFSATGEPLVGSRNCTARIAASSASKNLASCQHAGVKVVCIPQRGGKRTAKREAHENSAAFKEGQRFRAGIEGRISVLFRGRGMKRCLAEGHDRFELLVAAAVLANNLMRIAALLTQRSHRRRKAA
jgi:IS5 family transposase